MPRIRKVNDMRKPTEPLVNRPRMSRRAVLRGVGVTMALPWLESLPVFGAAPAATTEGAITGMAGEFPKRFAAVFMGNGINGNHWWPRVRALR